MEKSICSFCRYYKKIDEDRWVCAIGSKSDKYTCFLYNKPEQPDNVKHPAHYADTVPGIECIQVTQHFNFNRGNAIKYIWRAGHKNDEIEDLKKAIQYLEFEIKRIEEGNAKN
jgi:hypothetical protein